MRKKIVFITSIIFVLTFMFCLTSNLYAAKAGKHNGEVKQLDVNIEFSNSLGKTVTDEYGTHYYIYWRWLINEDKVYPEKYWGEFPLYFFGQEVGTTVTVKNNGPRQKAKVIIRTECYVLNTDGTNGAQLKDIEDIEVEVYRGQTKTIDASFVTQWTPEADSGLDRFIVKVLHPNEGGGPGNEEPALIMMKEGVFCPPEYEPDDER